MEQTEGQRRRRRGRRRKITEALLQCVMRGLACRLKPNSYGISMILCHPHGSGAAKQAYGKAPNICNIREVAPHPMRDLHTPCTAPGCSMGRLLQRKARKKKEFSEDTVISQKAPFPDIHRRDLSSSCVLYINRCYQTTVLGSNFFFFVLSLIYTYRLVRLLPPRFSLLDSCAAPLHLVAQHESLNVLES